MATAAELKMVNRVLFLLGQEPVVDLSEPALQQSIAAVKVMRSMDEARDTVLARHGWVCALEYATLSPAVLPGYANWRYQGVYLLPGDGLRVWEIEGSLQEEWGPRWQLGTRETGAGSQIIIRAQTEGALNLAYVRRANWSALDANLFDAVAHDCAARACYSVTADNARVAKLEQRAEAKVVLAISVDGTQEGGQAPLTPSIPEQLRNRARC